MKTCPNCGASVPEISKFCTSCGYAFKEVPVQPTQPAQPQPVFEQQNTPRTEETNNQTNQTTTTSSYISGVQLDKVKNSGQNYLNYFIDSLLHPSKVNKSDNKYFGLVSISILGLLIIFMLSRFFANFFKISYGFSRLGNSTFENEVSNFLDGTLQAKFDAGFRLFSTGLYTRIFIFTILVFAVFTVTLFLGRKFKNQEKIDFFEVTTEYGRYLSPLIVTTLFAALLMLMGLSAGVVVLFIGIIINSYILFYGFIKMFKTNFMAKFDQTYQFALIYLFDVFIVMMIFGVMVEGYARQVMVMLDM